MEIRIDVMDTAICTIISKTRVHHVLALYESIINNNVPSQLFIFCVDQESFSLLKKMNLSKAITIDFSVPEDSVLIDIKKDRKLNEYCWTLKPIALLYIFDNYLNIDKVIYADGDVYFFSDPIKLIKRIKKWSVILTTHKVSKKTNGGFICFRKDINGLSALKWWKEQCIKWCYSYEDNGNFGDQGHLNKLRRLFKNIYYLEHCGVNVASWNQHLYDIKVYNDTVYINDSRLIFYHFSGLRMVNKQDYAMCWKFEPEGFIYDHYIDILRKKIDEIERAILGFSNYFFSDF
ncbi:MAG: hypothetical protein PHF82_09595 [Lutispora sp.]|nr:hypothetical protein [Lutispora sp.]